jgi:hypothetical protein
MLTRSRRDLGGEVDRRSDPVQPVQLLLDPGRARRAGHPADRQIRAAYCAADCPGWALAGDRAHRYITPPGVVMGAPRPVRDQIFCRTDRVHAAVLLTAPGRPPRPGMQFRVVPGLVQRGRGRRPPVGLCVWRHTDHPLRRDTRWPPWRPGCRPYRRLRTRSLRLPSLLSVISFVAATRGPGAAGRRRRRATRRTGRPQPRGPPGGLLQRGSLDLGGVDDHAGVHGGNRNGGL